MLQLIQQTLRNSTSSKTKMLRHRNLNNGTPNLKLKFPPLEVSSNKEAKFEQETRRFSFLTSSTNNKSVTINLPTKRSGSINFSLQSCSELANL